MDRKGHDFDCSRRHFSSHRPEQNNIVLAAVLWTELARIDFAASKKGEVKRKADLKLGQPTSLETHKRDGEK